MTSTIRSYCPLNISLLTFTILWNSSLETLIIHFLILHLCFFVKGLEDVFVRQALNFSRKSILRNLQYLCGLVIALAELLQSKLHF